MGRSRDWAGVIEKLRKMSQTAARAADVEKMKLQMMQVWESTFFCWDYAKLTEESSK